MPESVLRCPGCGAPAAADAVRCDYCSSPLATVTCGSCFASMFVGSRFCSHCGAESSSERLEDERDEPCPRCKSVMQHLRLGGVQLRTCHDCGGLWLDPATMQKLVNSRESQSAVLSAITASVPSVLATPDVVRYVPCPVCTKLMNRRNFASASGVVMDVCKDHGVWLDRGELQRVVAFVEGGGLSVARQRELERLDAEQKRLRALLERPKGGFVAELHHTWQSHALSDNVGSTVGTLGGLMFEAIELMARFR